MGILSKIHLHNPMLPLAIPILIVLDGQTKSLGGRKSTEAQTFRTPIATSTSSALSFIPHSSTAHITSMTLPTLAILVRRLGLFWRTFDPVNGILLAEGNQQSLESVPSDDPSTICVHYNISSLSNSTGLTSEQYLTVPTPEATHFLFGTIPPFPRLSIPAFSIHSISAIHEVANVLDPSGRMSQKIHDVRSFVPNCTLGFSDIIPFAAPMMRTRGNALSRVPSPSQYTGGLTRHKDGFRIFRLRLGQYLTERAGTERMKWVRETYDKLLAAFPADWETEIQPMDSINTPSRIPFLDHCHNVWDQCTAYLVELNAVEPPADSELVPPYPSSTAPTPTGFTYNALMAAHLQHAVGYWSDAWKRVKDGTARDALGGHDWIAEGAHCYWDYLPRIVATLREGNALAEGTSEAKAKADEANMGGVEEEEEEEEDERSPIKATAVHEAWIVMMLRAFCWWRCHWTDQGWLGDGEGRVNPRYWDDGAATGTVDERRVYVF